MSSQRRGHPLEEIESGAVGGNGHILLRVDEEEDPRERWTERSMDRTHKLNQDGERLDAQSEPLRITIEGSRLRSCFQRRYLGGIKYWLVAWPVTNPFPTSLMDVPIGIDTMTCTGSGKSGPRTITLGLICSIRI